MHEEAIPILRVGDAAVSSKSTPTISQSPWRRASRKAAPRGRRETDRPPCPRCLVSVKPC